MPKLAKVTGAAQKDGRMFVTLTEHTDCAAAPTAGEGLLTMLIAWQDGYKTDLGSLRRTAGKGPPEITFLRASAASKMQPSKTFKASGTVTIVSAPKEAGATGKMKIDLQAGDYILAGNLDIQVCGK